MVLQMENRIRQLMGQCPGRDMDNDKWEYNGRSNKDWEVKLRKERERKSRRFRDRAVIKAFWK